jgi:hypothetical protein
VDRVGCYGANRALCARAGSGPCGPSMAANRSARNARASGWPVHRRRFKVLTKQTTPGTTMRVQHTCVTPPLGFDSPQKWAAKRRAGSRRARPACTGWAQGARRKPRLSHETRSGRRRTERGRSSSWQGLVGTANSLGLSGLSALRVQAALTQSVLRAAGTSHMAGEERQAGGRARARAPKGARARVRGGQVTRFGGRPCGGAGLVARGAGPARMDAEWQPLARCGRDGSIGAG